MVLLIPIKVAAIEGLPRGAIVRKRLLNALTADSIVLFEVLFDFTENIGCYPECAVAPSDGNAFCRDVDYKGGLAMRWNASEARSMGKSCSPVCASKNTILVVEADAGCVEAFAVVTSKAPLSSRSQ